MANFQCSNCGFTNIDLGKRGYFTPKEINLAIVTQMAAKLLMNQKEGAVITKEQEDEAQQVIKTACKLLVEYRLQYVIDEVGEMILQPSN